MGNRIFVLGFSVGATIAWICSKELDLCNGVIGFYGSRIRDYLEIDPTCPVLLFLPTEEKSFNVSELVGLLKTKENVFVKQLCGQHGFTNPSSPIYNNHSTCQAYIKKNSVSMKLNVQMLKLNALFIVLKIMFTCHLKILLVLHY